MKQFALIGSTASGKSNLALSLADRYNALILSIDSLSIYKEIDIASAKPTHEDREGIPHFGIDLLAPDQPANVFTFIDEYNRAQKEALLLEKNLIIVGGSSFYLKSMIEGLSEIPPISPEVHRQTEEMLRDLESAHAYLVKIDPLTMAKIASSDRYRIEKMLHLTLQTHLPPSQWFALHPPRPIIEECPVLNLTMERSILRQRISLRSDKMVEMGIVDEVAELERKYGRSPNSMKAIGIVEVLEYLDGNFSKAQMVDHIATHTAQLAKRQQTFNAHQFELSLSGTADEIRQWIEVKMKN